MIIPNAKPVSEMAEGISAFAEGTYNLKVNKAEYVAVPKGKESKGPYIKVQHLVTGQPGQVESAATGRLVFMNYSMAGDGTFRLRELLEATGHPADFTLTNTDELLNLEFTAVVTVEKGEGSYPDKNVIKRHLALATA